ncbi:MAG TPA: hypothetical protein VLB50_01995 [Ignavibacteriaceae bacterium]|nr:hypothetical protein [Ignavibacteriaceae bacterium]
MNFQELNRSSKLFLSSGDIAGILSIDKESAKVTASRYLKKGYLIRLKRDIYITENKFKNLSEAEVFRLTNLIQVPSYISLITALGYYNITTQQQRNYIESIAVKRTKNISIRGIQFTYTKIKKNLYTGFQLREGYFIALPEKALADIVYLASLQKYDCDFPSINFRKLNKSETDKYLKYSNPRTLNFWDDLCRTYKI